MQNCNGNRNNKGHKSNQYNSVWRKRITNTLTGDKWAEKPLMASDYSRVKKLSVSVHCWTGAQNLQGIGDCSCVTRKCRGSTFLSVFSRLLLVQGNTVNVESSGSTCQMVIHWGLGKNQEKQPCGWRNSIAALIQILYIFFPYILPRFWKWALGSGV